MPRRKSISNSKVEDFEPKKKNPLSLLNDSNLDIDSKPLFIGDKPSGIELSDSEFRFLKPSTHTRLNADTLFCNEFLLDSSGDSNLTFRHILGDDDQNMKFFISTAGATTWQTNGSSGTFNVDAVGAINLDTDSGEFYISDDSAIHLFFDCNNTALTIYDDEDTGDLFKIQIAQHGATTISTVDDDASAGHLTLDADGQIIIDSVNSSGAITDGTLFKTDGTTFGSITTHHSLSCFTLFEAGGSSTDDYLEIQVDAAGATSINTVDAGGATAHLTLNPDGNVFVSGAHLTLDATKEVVLDGSGGHTKISESVADFMNFQVGGEDLMAIQEKAATSVAQSSKIWTGCPVMLKDIGGAADTPTSGYGSIYVNSDVLYFKTDGGTETNLLAGGGGTQYWNQMVPGYATNKTSTTLYYTFFRAWYENWNNSDSSPTTISDTDTYSTYFIAPRNGSITNVKIQGYATDTGATDPFRFYFYKGASISNADTMSLTALFNTGAITPPSAHKTWTYTGDFSSSNTFSEDDCLYVFWKKDSNSGSQDVYWNMNISGEYS